MVETFAHPEHVPLWHAAMRNEPVDWHALFDGYEATVDWPGAAVWREIRAAYPDALVLLSTRRTSDEWYTSASRTIFAIQDSTAPPDMAERRAMNRTMFDRFTPDWHDAEAAKAAYERRSKHGSEAEEWHRRVVESGDIDASVELGVYHVYGGYQPRATVAYGSHTYMPSSRLTMRDDTGYQRN
jgi:hypothetical protein